MNILLDLLWLVVWNMNVIFPQPDIILYCLLNRLSLNNSKFSCKLRAEF